MRTKNKVQQLVPNNQPRDWFNMMTNECSEYPIHLFNKISKDCFVIDCGCNVGGFYNRYKAVSDNWICIDASSFNITEFNKNNKNHKCHLLQRALTDQDNKILKLKKYTDEKLNDTPSGNFGVLDFVYQHNNHGWKDDEYEEVESMSLESVLKINNNKIDILKVDIEGSEYDFLYNKDLSNIQYITMELHNFLGDKKNDLCQWINKTHKEIFSRGDGVKSHFLKAWELK